jgi:hypothetical protein
LDEPGDQVAVAIRPDATADPFDGFQFGVAELVLVAARPTASRTQRAAVGARSSSAWATRW